MASANREYTKMSIHCHLGGLDADCKIDTPICHEPRFELTTAYEEINEAHQEGYTLLAQTNSNCVDAASWLLARKYAQSQGIELLPGTEINLKNWEDEGILHVVVVFPPTANVLQLQMKMRDICIANGENCFEINQLCDLLCESRAVICIHGIKQDNRSIRGNPQMAKELVGLNHYFPVAFEDNKSFHKDVLVESIKEFLAERQVDWLKKAADVSAVDRKRFSDIQSPTYIWAGNTFEDLYYCVLTGASRIVREEDIVTRPSFIARIKIDGSEQMTQSDISCSQGLNCIIGPSGSGKTLLLDILKYKMKSEHLTETTSSKPNYSSIYKSEHIHLFGPDGNELDPTFGFEVIEGENLYQKVLRAYQGNRAELMRELGLEVDTSQYSEMIQEFETKANHYLRKLQEIQHSQLRAATALAQVKSAHLFVCANDTKHVDVIAYNQDSSIKTKVEILGADKKTCETDLLSATKAFKELKEIAERQGFSSGLINQLDSLANAYLTQLMSKITCIKQCIDSLIFKQKRQSLLFSACQVYNGQVSKQFEQVTEKKQLIGDKLEELAQSLLSSKAGTYKLSAPSLNPKKLADSLALKSTNDAAKLEIHIIPLIVFREDLKNIFPSNIATRAAGKARISAFEGPYDLSKEESVTNLLDIFFSEGVLDGLSISLPVEEAISYSIKLEDEEGIFRPIDEFSAGMLSKVYVSYFLDSAISNAGSNTIILYDQPESNMEKAFLIDTLADKFSKLRRTHQIFVATHEPLLVVNADANEIILATNEKKVNQPNQIFYENRSFVGINGRSSLIEDVAGLIDGGTGAVRHRSEVYEGMKK
ncbi:AAA family ATPase [Arabiibacter massiliensis]|uniref:AAA family ATPase n=1 Tax=Arabiibacter massiliensis TaxID=1870985 RepID=UPI00155AF3FE|nr:AAA family ATPase [Arabiibacter massiliensis]